MQAINVSLGAWHVEFAWVVAYSPLVGRKPPRCQQLAEPDSPTFSAQWFTDAGGADILRSKDSGSQVSSKGLSRLTR